VRFAAAADLIGNHVPVDVTRARPLSLEGELPVPAALAAS
jgi:hypothetical protein